MESKDRLKKIRTKFGLTQAQAAQKIGVIQQTWAAMERGGNGVSKKNAKKIEDAFGVPALWITEGIGTIDGIEEKGNPLKKVPIVNTSVLAGLTENFHPPSQEIDNYISIPDLDPKREYIATKVSGRSMEPLFRENSTIVLVEMTERSEFKDGKPYVIIVQGVPFLKRVNLILDGEHKGKFQITSDNENRTQTIEPEEITQWYKVTHVLNTI